ncbi:hypothetical protein HYX14_01690 [Candidatus Woesearchaeota archaeon]|nr:hypothetical protein [Candidatus Woesearchaeota archaeon]
MVAAEKLVLYAIAIITGVIIIGIFFVPESGALEKVKAASLKAKEFLPKIGAEELKAGAVEIPAEHWQQIRKLKEAIETMKAGDGGCFLNYGGFPPLGEKGTSIVLEHDASKDATIISVYGGAGGTQLSTELSLSIIGIVPCVIAGSEDLVKGFEQTYLNPASSQERSTAAYFNPVTRVKIAFDTGGWDENRIDYGAGLQDFEGQAWLFTPDNRHICFFPTVDGASSAQGLNDDDLLTTIPQLLQENKIKLCQT